MPIVVSIIIPNYNHADYLNERIDSVLNQTFRNFELIILDDCSSDKSREIIEQYRNHPNVSNIIYNESNSGSTFYQWNKGVNLAKGKYIWIAESDDVADINFLQKTVPPLETDSNVVISYCQSYKYNSKNEITGNWLYQTDDLDREFFLSNFLIDGNEYIKKFLIYRNTIPNASAVVFKKDVYTSVKGADPNVKYCSDWLTWLKILTKGDIAYTSLCLNYFRYNEKSVIGSSGFALSFVKKFDIKMRFFFADFLKLSSPMSKEIFIKNSHFIKKELGSEFKFSLKKRKFLDSIDYLFLLISIRIFNRYYK